MCIGGGWGDWGVGMGPEKLKETEREKERACKGLSGLEKLLVRKSPTAS